MQQKPRVTIVIYYTNGQLVLLKKNSIWPPPKTMPDDLKDSYTMGGKIPTLSRYLMTEQYNGGSGYTWSEKYVNNLIFQEKKSLWSLWIGSL